MTKKYLLITIPIVIMTLMWGFVFAPQDTSAEENFLVKPYLVYPADKPMYPEYETAINNELAELRNWYLENVGMTFELAPLQIKRTSENYLTIRCGENPSQECIDDPKRFDVDSLIPLNEAVHDGQVDWVWEREQEEKSIALIFGAGWGGGAGANGFTDGQYAGDYGFAFSGDWVLEPISGVTNTWGVPCSYSDGWQCAEGVPEGTIAHELTHAFGLPHPDEGPSIMYWHGDYPTVGFLSYEIEFLQESPFLKAACTGTETDFVGAGVPSLTDLNYTTFETCEDSTGVPRQDVCAPVFGTDVSDPLQLSEYYCYTGGSTPACAKVVALCPAGTNCVSGACVATGCTDDSACGLGKICDVDGTCKSCSGAGPGTVGPCLIDSHCGGGGDLCDISHTCRSCGTGSCIDTDGDSGPLGTPFTSLNITTAGVCKDKNGITFLDSCSGSLLTEYFCLGSGLCSSVGAACPSGFKCIAGTGRCSAISSTGGTVSFENPLETDLLKELLDRVLDILIIFGTSLYVLMILIVAFIYTTSGANPQKRVTAKNILIFSTIGFFILITGRVILFAITSFVL